MTQYVFTSDFSNVDALISNARDAARAGKRTAAARLFRRAIEIAPNDPRLLDEFGRFSAARGVFDDAEAALRRALAVKRDYPDALVHLADLLLERLEPQGRVNLRYDSSNVDCDPYDEPERLLRDALRLDSDRLDAILLLALILERRSQLVACREMLERARNLHPDPATLSQFMAGISAKMCDWQSATAELERAAAIRPGVFDVEYRLGDFYGRQGEWERSKEHFRKAAAIKGARSAIRWKHLGVAPVYFETTDAINEYWRKLELELDEAIAERPRYDWRALPYEAGVPSFTLAHCNRSCREIREKFARLYAPSFEGVKTERFERVGSGKIRIGYFLLPTEELVFMRSMKGIINRMDASRFEHFLLHLPASRPYLEKRTRATAVDLSNSFETAVARIRELKLDAIYFRNVGGGAWSFFLPMLRLAPVQAASWGDLGTSGVFDVDYYLSHRLTEISGAQAHYTEQLELLEEAPRFEERAPQVENASREALGLPTTGALYFCPHRLAKYHPDYDLYLKEILESDPTGTILLTLRTAECADSQKLRDRIARNVGPTLAKRLIFRSRMSLGEYRRVFAASTALLDSCVYSGCLTLYDAASYGVPSASLIGDLCVQRFPVGAYAAMGVDNPPFARSREEYVRCAVEIGTNADYRRALSEQILAGRDAIFERESAVAEFERFWERAVDRRRRP